MPIISEETDRTIRAFAYYFGIDEKEMEFWLKQWRLSTLTKTKPKKNESN